ncbi:MAG: glutamate 5-kinase [Candidatus Omnitrophica bacterium]|nr:glutamate 5-kinase [Candidatus Omnitrophota bacterium]
MKLSENYRRLVIKVGTSILTDSANHLDIGFINNIAYQVSALVGEGREVVVVSSGAIACGLDNLSLTKRPTKLDKLSALASLGQIRLMEAYQNAFRKYHNNCAQVLLTWDDFDKRARFLNAKKTLNQLFKYKSVAIINENDSVSTEEIKFGDNDRLSALVATLISSDILIILSDVDGLFDRKNNRLINLVEKIDNEIMRLACGSKKFSCVGGMHTKLEAVKIANNAGIPCILANGKTKDILIDIAKGESPGTFFCAGTRPKDKKNWIATSAKCKGAIVVDAGAKAAIIARKKSLLSVGIIEAQGEFKENDVVFIADMAGSKFAKGITRFSAQKINQIKGKKGQPEVVHRDCLIVIE